jgi:hypothetical protein
MTTAVITTFSIAGKKLYGDNFIKSFLQCWPKSIKLIVYYENWAPDILDDQIIYKDIKSEIPEVKHFIDHCKSKISELPKDSKKAKPINWYNKAIRWSFKSLVMYKELKNSNYDHLIWLDGDVTTLQKVRDSIATDILGKATFASQMQVIDGTNHCESGIAVFSVKDEQTITIIDHLKNGYIDFQILKLKKPWDGFWLALLENKVRFYDMNNSKDHHPSYNRTFFNKHIAGILTHNVGNKKLKDAGLHKITGRNIDETWDI